jgi:hypothetical protein
MCSLASVLFAYVEEAVLCVVVVNRGLVEVVQPETRKRIMKKHDKRL